MGSWSFASLQSLLCFFSQSLTSPLFGVSASQNDFCLSFQFPCHLTFFLFSFIRDRGTLGGGKTQILECSLAFSSPTHLLAHAQWMWIVFVTFLYGWHPHISSWKCPALLKVILDEMSIKWHHPPQCSRKHVIRALNLT